MDRQEASSFIRQSGWLATTPDEFKEQILAKCNLLAVSAGSTIFRAADSTASIFAVVEGQFELHLALQGQDPTLAHICGPGSWLGNTAAMTGRRRRITAIAGANGCHTLQLTAAQVGRIADRDPRAWRYFAELHARNYLTALDVIDALKRSDPEDRLVATLCNLLDGLTKGNKLLDVSQSDIAALTRLGRSKVNAILNDLERQDLVRRKYGSVEIPNVAALRRFKSAGGRP